MRIAVTSDWHGYLPVRVPECDLMVVAGDIGLGENFSQFNPELLLSDLWKWIEEQPYKIVAVAGNHDFRPEVLRALPWTYLEDEAVEIDGVTFWGSPWSNPFGYGWAFNMPEEKQEEVLALIPEETKVVISHGPPYGLRDQTFGYAPDPVHVGSRALRKRMEELPNLQLLACGHIHSSYGRDGIVVNGSLVNERYQIANAPYLFSVE